MENERLRELFQKYIDQSYTSEEYGEFMRLVERTDDQEIELVLDRAYSEEANHHLDKPDAERIISNIINAEQQHISRIKKWLWIGYSAASIALACGIGLMFMHNVKDKAEAGISLISSKPVIDHHLIRFSDGSTVVLNKNSYVEYPGKFTGQKREVSLVGEGYFDIKHDNQHPFLVHAGKLTVTVLGTAFNIKSSAKRTAVTVTRGKVSVSDGHQLLGAITPNQRITYNNENQLAKLESTNGQRSIAWQSSDLFFDNTSVKEAAKILESRFGKKMRFEGEQAKNYVFSGAFTHGEKQADIVKVICAFNKIEYEEKSDVIIIK